MSKLDTFIERMEYWCEVADLGYDQANRWDIRDGGTCDCSSLVYWCLWESGLLEKPDDLYERAYYTGTIRRDLEAAGWKAVDFSFENVKPGDILLNYANHVAVSIYGNNWSSFVAQGSIDENGNITGGKPGDQSGRETNIRAIYDYPWDIVMRISEGENMPSAEEITETIMNHDLAVGDGSTVPVWQLLSWGYYYSKKTYQLLQDITEYIAKNNEERE